MQYKQGSETVDMINTPYILVSRPLSSNEDPEGLIVASTITIIFGPTIDICLIGNGDIVKIAGCLISILFYTFGIFVAYRYYQTGLRVVDHFDCRKRRLIWPETAIERRITALILTLFRRFLGRG
ncbi:unnamed protein product [Rotaria sordida]|uniref:Uncharacterized protein n=1 Tax=Rotaria sordida TaxID=392033 RepID=A0A819IDE9_9BILA|nr:unnamed protein product [Rotaria sordida]CAF3911211.1 unnamed protein product [Rotaria sordida]